MKKIIKLFTFLILGLTVIMSSTQVNAQDDIIKAGTEGSIFPWAYTENNEIIGFDPDIINEISKRIGKDIQLEAIEWAGLFGSFDSGRIDTVANIVTINEERKEKYNFTKPYAYNPMAIATKSDSKIEKLEDMDGKSIVVEVGSSDEQVVDALEERLGIKLNRVYYDGISVSDVESGRVDLWIGGLPSLTTMIEKGEYDLKIIDTTGEYQEYGFPFPKNEKGDELLKEFDKALDEMREDGTLAEISKKWLGMDITSVPE